MSKLTLMREQKVNRSQRVGPKVLRTLAVVSGLALIAAGIAVATQSQLGGIESVSRWLVFALLLSGVLAMTWSPATPEHDGEESEIQSVHYMGSGR